MDSFKIYYVDINGDRNLMATGFHSEDAADKYIEDFCLPHPGFKVAVGYYEVRKANPLPKPSYIENTANLFR